MHTVEAVLGLIVLAIAVAALADRLRTPAPSLLVVVGLAVGFVPGVPDVSVAPQVITLVVLPPLLFAAAQQIPLDQLASVWRTVAGLAIGLVLVTAAVIAGVTAAISGVAAAAAFVLGAVLASTDPVAVTALSRRLRLPRRVAAVVESESLFNDATSLVLFQVAVVVVTSGGMSLPAAAWRFVLIAGGGALVGVAVGFASGALLGRADEPTIETAIAVVTPYVAAVVAEALDVSLVMAVIVAGFSLAPRHVRATQPRGRLMAASVYDTAIFLLESAVFALIGLELSAFLRHLPHADRGIALGLTAAVTATLLGVRAIALLGMVSVPRLLGGRRAGHDADERRWASAAVVTWAGARGVVPLAAALSIPLTLKNGAPFPHRALLLVVAAGATVVTLVVQGTTLEPLVRRLGVVRDTSDDSEAAERARYAIVSAALARLPETADLEDAPPWVVESLRAELERRLDTARIGLAGDQDPAATRAAYGRVRRRLLEVEMEELGRLRAAGAVTTEVYRALQRSLDLEAARVGG